MRVRRGVAGLLLTVGLSATAAARAAQDVQVEAAAAGELVEVRASARIEAPQALVWSTLTDYEGMPGFVRSMRRSEIKARHGSTLIVEQSGEARFLFLTYPIDVTLEVTERPPKRIEVRALSGTLRHLEGRYEIDAVDCGRHIVLRWTGAIMPDVALPPLIGGVLMRLMIEDQFSEMVREIERREALRRQKEGPTK